MTISNEIPKERRTWGNRPSLAETNPALAAQWHSSKNEKTTTFMVTPGSNRVAWWRCEQQHEWPARIADRTDGTGCPKCSGGRLKLGRNDFMSVSPSAASEWHPTLNGAVLPSEVSAHSHQQYWFVCREAEHVYAAELASRSAGTGCGFCSGNVVLAGFNDLATIFPRLAGEWHPERNGMLQPTMVTAHSKKRVFWRCMKGHHWEAAVYSRASGRGCPFCSGKQPLLGFNTLQDLRPDVARQWRASEKSLSPAQVTVSSGVVVTWQCDKQHTWEARVAERTAGQNCPFCSGKRPWLGQTDLGTVRPDVAAWWHPENTSTPGDHTQFSNAKVLWRCPTGHVWKARIAKRSSGHGCRECSKHQSSEIEHRFRDSFADLLTNARGESVISNESGHYDKATFKVDIEGEWNGRKVVVEYDGIRWHRDEATFGVDGGKTRALLAMGYVVVRIRENALPFLTIQHPRLFQLSYRYKERTPTMLQVSISTTLRQVGEWLNMLDGGGQRNEAWTTRFMRCWARVLGWFRSAATARAI